MNFLNQKEYLCLLLYKFYLDKVDLINIRRLACWFLAECYSDEDLYEELEINIPDSFLSPALSLSNFIYSALLVETCENCEKLFHTRFRY